MKGKVCVSIDSDILSMIEEAKRANPSISRSSLINSALRMYFSTIEFSNNTVRVVQGGVSAR